MRAPAAWCGLAACALVALVALAVPAGAAAARPSDDAPWDPGDWSAVFGALGDVTIEPDAISPDGDGTSDALELAWTSTRAARVVITVADASGRAVRTIDPGQQSAGPARLAWNGLDDAGARLPDGEYQVTITASAGADSTSTTETVAIDTTAPRLKLAATTVALARATGTATLRQPVWTSEPALLQLRVAAGPARAAATAANGVTARRASAGAGTLAVPVGSRAARARLRKVARLTSTVLVTATDAAGNSTTATAPLTLVAPAPASSGSTGAGAVPPAPTPAPSPGASGSTSGMQWPLSGAITSHFGPRWGRMHYGLDIAATTGTPIHAALAGTVTYSGTMSGYGNIVIVDHGGGISTRYAHQSRRASTVGEHLAKGQLLGYVGATGDATGPHLHFEVRIGDVAKDPLGYLP